VRLNLEIVFLIGTQTTRVAHSTYAFIQGLIVSLRGERLRSDVHRAFRFTVILKKSCDRHDAKVILALAEGSSFLGEHTDNCVTVAADSHHFADRRFVREQSSLDHSADDNHPA